MTTKKEIRPIYSELQGLLAEAPKKETKSGLISARHLWEHCNKTIEELSQISEHDYSRFKMTPAGQMNHQYIDVNDYRGRLGALIARLHAEYFSDEPAPFTGMPSTSIQVNQQQSQSVQVEIVMEMTEIITKKLSEVPEGSKEKSFLEKIKGSLKTIHTISELITLLLITAKEFGLSIDQLKDLLS